MEKPNISSIETHLKGVDYILNNFPFGKNIKYYALMYKIFICNGSLIGEKLNPQLLTNALNKYLFNNNISLLSPKEVIKDMQLLSNISESLINDDLLTPADVVLQIYNKISIANDYRRLQRPEINSNQCQEAYIYILGEYKDSVEN